MKMLNKIIGGGVAIAAVLAFSASTIQAQQNLLVNGDFEYAGMNSNLGGTDLGTPGNGDATSGSFTINPITATSGPGGLIPGVNQGWATYGATGQSDMSSSSDSPQSGLYSLLVQNAPGNNWNPGGGYQLVSPVGGVIAGATYTLTGYFLTDTGVSWSGGGVGCVLGFRGPWDGATYPVLGTDSANYWSGVSGLDTWTPFTLTEVAPVGATEIVVYAQFMDNGQTTTENMYFDNFSVTVPEPSSLALVGMGLAAIPFYFIRRQKS